MSAESILRIVLQAVLQGGDELSTLVDDLTGVEQVAGEVTEATAGLSAGLDGAASSAEEWTGQLVAAGEAAEETAESVGELGDELEDTGDAGGDFGGGLDKLMDVSGGFGKATKLAGAELRMLAEAFDYAEAEATRLGRTDVADKIKQMKDDVGDFKDALLQLPIPLISFPGVEARGFLDWMGDAAQGLSNLTDLAGAVSVQFQLATGQMTQDQAITAINDLTGETERLAAAAEEVAAANEKAANSANAQRWQGLADAYQHTADEASAAAAAVASTEAALAAATSAAAEAQAAAQDSLDARVTGYYDLAAALKDATNLELAQTELQQIQALFDAGVISQAEYKTATEGIGLAFGIFTPQSLALSAATDELTRMYASGKITADELTTATGNLSAAAADGQVDMSELGIVIKDQVAPEFSVARDKAEEFEGKLDDLDGRIVPVTVPKDQMLEAAEAAQGYTDKLNTIDGRVVTASIVTTHTDVYNSTGAPTYGSDGYEHGPGFASGVDMIVPPGFGGDSFPFRAQSGERVIVIPPGEPGNGGSAPGGGGGGSDAMLAALLRSLPAAIGTAVRDAMQMA